MKEPGPRPQECRAREQDLEPFAIEGHALALSILKPLKRAVAKACHDLLAFQFIEFAERAFYERQVENGDVLAVAEQPELYREIYVRGNLADVNPAWQTVSAPTGDIYPWEAKSNYIKEPPFLAEEFRQTVLTPIIGARALAILGDSVTTDHISPIGSIKSNSPAGSYLRGLGVEPVAFNN